MKRLLIAIALACVLSGTALAGEMPGVPGPGSVVGEAPTVPSTSPGETQTPPVPGEVPGVPSASSNGMDESLVTTALLTLLTALLGR
jgi:hypothetical protein